MRALMYEIQIFEPRIKEWLRYEKEWTKAKGIKSYEFAKKEWSHIGIRLVETSPYDFQESVLYEWVPDAHRGSPRERIQGLANDFGDLLEKQYLEDCNVRISAQYSKDGGWKFNITANPTDAKTNAKIVLASGSA